VQISIERNRQRNTAHNALSERSATVFKTNAIDWLEAQPNPILDDCYDSKVSINQ